MRSESKTIAFVTYDIASFGVFAGVIQALVQDAHVRTIIYLISLYLCSLTILGA